MTKKLLALSILGTGLISGVLAWTLPPWAATLFGLYFSLIIPGLLLFLVIKRKFEFKWDSVLSVVGLGISSLLFEALASNWLLKPLGVSRPLSPEPLFLSVGFASLVMLAVGFYRWASHPFKVPKIAFSWADTTTLIWPLILLVGYIGGAIRLNNGASGWLSVVCYFLTAAFVVWLFVVHKRVKEGSIIWALWLLALGVLLSGWLRSDYVTGADVVKEFQIFELVKHAGYWSISLYYNAYTACLSVSLLPLALSVFSKLPDALIFKLLIPAIYSLIIPIVYLIARTQLKTRGAILATVFFFAQPPFTIWWWIPIRQEIAFLFFGLLVLVFVTTKKEASSKALFIIFGASMVVSHYSTSYIAIGLMLLFCLIQTTVKRLGRKPGSDPSFLKYTYVLILLLFTFLWYSQLTTGFNGATQFVTKSVQNIGSLFSSDVQQQGQTPFGHLDIFSKAGTASVTPSQYAQNHISQAQSQYAKGDLYNTNYGFQPSSYQPRDSALSLDLNLLRNILKVLGNLLVSLGVIVVVAMALKKKKTTRLIWFQLSALLFLVAALFLPFFSISYGEDRLYLQLLIIISAAIATYPSFGFLKLHWEQLTQSSVLAFVVIYFLVLNQVPQQLTTSSQESVNLGNYNTDYYEYYISQADSTASQWLKQNISGHRDPVVADYYAQSRLTTEIGLLSFGPTQVGVFPDSLTRGSYIYEDSANTQTGSGFDYDEGLILYKFPQDFLEQNKNVIYTSAQDRIFK